MGASCSPRGDTSPTWSWSRPHPHIGTRPHVGQTLVISIFGVSLGLTTKVIRVSSHTSSSLTRPHLPPSPQTSVQPVSPVVPLSGCHCLLCLSTTTTLQRTQRDINYGRCQIPRSNLCHQPLISPPGTALPFIPLALCESLHRIFLARKRRVGRIVVVALGTVGARADPYLCHTSAHPFAKASHLPRWTSRRSVRPLILAFPLILHKHTL